MRGQSQREGKEERVNTNRTSLVPPRPLSGWAKKNMRERLRNKPAWTSPAEQARCPADFGNAV